MTGRASDMARDSSSQLLTLHALRLRGMADERAVRMRFGIDAGEVHEHLLDFEAHGWVRKVDYPGTDAWWLTDLGRAQNEALLAEELEVSGRREAVTECYRTFLDLNERLLRACTNWQIRATPWDSLAANDHTDWAWDERVLRELATLGRSLPEVDAGLSAALSRFAGYHQRFAAALDRVDRGDRSWVDRPGQDSCHAVWFELHEDLIATLGLRRGEEEDRGTGAVPT